MNQEHLEAAQEAVNKLKQEQIMQLTEKEKEDFATVEQAVKTLVDKKIKFYLFAELPIVYSEDGYKTTCVWQYNSILALYEWGTDGKRTEKSQKEVSRFNEKFMYTLCRVFGGEKNMNGPVRSSVKHFWDFFITCLEQYCINENQKHNEFKANKTS